MPNVRFNTVRAIIAHPITDNDFLISQVPVDVSSGGTPAGTVTVQDRSMLNETTALLTTNAQVYVSSLCTFRSANPNVGTVDPNSGYVTRVANGPVRIIADGQKTVSKSIIATMAQLGGQSTSVFQNYIPGCLATHCSNAIDTRLAGKTYNANAPVYTTKVPWVREPNCWLYDVGGMSAISNYNSIYGVRVQQTLITPRHCMGVHHGYLSVGAWVQFVSDDGLNTLCQRNVIGIERVIGVDGGWTDFDVCLLDADVDAGITPIEFLPVNWYTKLPSQPHFIEPDVGGLSTWKLPLIFHAVNHLAEVIEFVNEKGQNLIPGAGGGPPYLDWRLSHSTPLSGQRALFKHGPPISGDSGSPMALIINNKLSLMMLYSCNSTPNYLVAIKNSITALGGSAASYNLAQTNISSFPTIV